MRAEREVAARGEVRAGEGDAGVGVGEQTLARDTDAADAALFGGEAKVAGNARGAARADGGIALDRQSEAHRASRAVEGQQVLIQALVAAVERERELAAVAGDEAVQQRERVEIEADRVAVEKAERQTALDGDIHIAR